MAGQTTTIVTTQHLSSGTWTTGVCDCCSDMGTCKSPIDPWTRACGLLRVLDMVLLKHFLPQGSCCDDFCTLCFCYPCAWCQMSREIKIRARSGSVVTQQITHS
uniref:Plac8 onzin related protein 1 n=1 Tax=Cyprinus carpio TaxID=7962 RepID=A0A8C2EEJ5_CYPCA